MSIRYYLEESFANLRQNKLRSILTGFGVAFFIWACWLIYRIFQIRKPERHPLLRTLRHEPQRIVWVYSVQTQRMPFGFQTTNSGTLYFKLEDGDQHTVNLPAAALRPVSEMLNQMLPHASFGYTADREQWYMAHPEMLRQDPEDRSRFAG